MSTFTFTPDFGATKTSKPKVTTVKFGDGYEARYGFGINLKPDSWSVNFSLRDSIEAKAIDDFLSARNGIESFDWTPPGETVSKKFKCESWTVKTEKANNFSITATFDQVFEP